MISFCITAEFYMLIYERKCFYYRTVKENDQVVIQYNTNEPPLDQRHNQDKLEASYLMEIISRMNQPVTNITLSSRGEQRVDLQSMDEYQFCVKIVTSGEDEQKQLREYKRAAKRVEINITSDAEIQKLKQIQDEMVEKTTRLGNKILAAKSQQDGSQYRRNHIEGGYLGVGTWFKFISAFSFIVYVLLSVWATNTIKGHLKGLKM